MSGWGKRALILTAAFQAFACAAVATEEPATLLGPAPPYTPRKTDYSIELGPMSSKDDLFWTGAMMGAHVGNCVFTRSETCQQFIDAIAGVGVAEGETQGHLWLSPRWQYVNFPDRYSPFWRVGAGVANVARPGGRGIRGVGIAGVGITTYLHDKVDLHLEARFVGLDRSYAQILFGLNFKGDRLLQYFAGKLRDIGIGVGKTAIDATGTALEATGEGIGGIVHGVAAPFQSATPAPTPAPGPRK